MRMMNKVLKELGAMSLAIIINVIPILTTCSFIFLKDTEI